MYRIIIENDGVRQVLHSEDPDSMQRLLSGTMTEEVGASPSLTGTVSPQNACYNDSTTGARISPSPTSKAEKTSLRAMS